MSTVSLIKPIGTHVSIPRRICQDTNVRPGISALASSLPIENKIKSSFLLKFLKWSKQSDIGQFLFKVTTLGLQLTNSLAHTFKLDLGIDKFIEKELNKHLFRTDLSDPLPPNIDINSLIKLENKGEPTLYGHFFESPNSKVLAIFLHGFGSTIFEDTPNCLRIQKELNTNVLCVDYRGYGLSEGTPTIDGVTKDAIRMYDYATKTKGYDGKNIIFVGISLGGPIALEAYSILKQQKKSLGAMAILYPFSSIRDITRWRVPEVPAYFLPDDKFNAKRLAKSVSIPIHIACGDLDKDTPNKQSKQVYKNVPGTNKEIFILQGIGHNSLGTSDHPSVANYFSSLRKWVKEYFPNASLK